MEPNAGVVRRLLSPKDGILPFIKAQKARRRDSFGLPPSGKTQASLPQANQQKALAPNVRAGKIAVPHAFHVGHLALSVFLSDGDVFHVFCFPFPFFSVYHGKAPVATGFFYLTDHFFIPQNKNACFCKQAFERYKVLITKVFITWRLMRI
jgi:hypothetical protein